VTHPARAAAFVRDEERAHWHDRALWFVRAKRDRAAAEVPEWEELRERAAMIKQHTLSRLPEYLETFEERATALGAVVHWASDARRHNEIVLEILRSRQVRRVAKSKSMLTEECGLNEHLEANGIEVTDTDLGERIVQMRHEPPSHIVLPAIHIRKEEVGELFHRELGTPEGLADPTSLTEAARQHLREKFLSAEAGITGVNFAIAETGGFVVCTNEGNADLGASLPKLHVACMGIEKLVPRAEDLAPLLRLLARSATGQPITSYTSHFHGPIEGGELHIVLVDNGRSELLASAEFQRSLRCIRCGACMNTCPVYRRSGGHSYDAVVPGPIGSILSPARDEARHASLPYACTLCGSCTDVCPVKIDLHQQLQAWRGRLTERGKVPAARRVAMRLGSAVLRRPRLYALASRMAQLFGMRWAALAGSGRAWARGRAIPGAARRSFRQQFRERRDG
jgi:L-lactate dehydrogenase complex protein LldF